MAVSDSIADNTASDPASEPVADWQTVPPVRGFWRPFDTFFGPGMTTREWVVLWAGIAIACGGTIVLWVREDAHETFSTAALV